MEQSDSTAKPQAKTSQLGYQEAIEQVSDSAVFLLDAKCRVTSWNRGSKTLKGYNAEEIIGKPFFRFYPEKDQSAGKPIEILNQAVRHGSVVEEGWRVRKDGTEFWAHIITTTLYDDHKKVAGFIKIVNNYSEHKRLDNQRESLVQTTQTQKKLINLQKTEIRQLKKQLGRGLNLSKKDDKSLTW